MDVKIRETPEKPLKIKRVRKGLWEVEGAYSGDYDFFAPSPLYSFRSRDSESRKSKAQVQARSAGK